MTEKSQTKLTKVQLAMTAYDSEEVLMYTTHLHNRYDLRGKILWEMVKSTMQPFDIAQTQQVEHSTVVVNYMLHIVRMR